MMKFLNDIDLGLCELQNHILHIVGTSQTSTQGQIYFSTDSSANQLEYYDGVSTNVPITNIEFSDDNGGVYSVSTSKQASFWLSGDGLNIDVSTTLGTFIFTNEHKTIQSMSDLDSTPGASNDGYALLWNNTGSYFELVDLATVTTSGSFVTTNTNQQVDGEKTFGNQAIFEDNVIIQGDLTVSGNTTTVTSETTLVEDNLFVLNSNHSGTPTQDAGLLVNRGTSTNVAFIWDESNDEWVLISTSDDGTGTTPAITGYSTLKLGTLNALDNVQVDGFLTADLGLTVNDVVTFNVLSGNTPDDTDTEFVVRNAGSNELERLTLGDLKAEVGGKVTGTITGNGVLTSFTFTHNIGSTAVDVTLIEDSTGDKVYTTIRNISTTQSQVTFKYPVTASKTYTVIAQ